MSYAKLGVVKVPSKKKLTFSKNAKSKRHRREHLNPLMEILIPERRVMFHTGMMFHFMMDLIFNVVLKEANFRVVRNRELPLQEP